MSKYLIKQRNERTFHEEYKRYIIYKKKWYGWSWQVDTIEIEKLKALIENLVSIGNEVYKHWTAVNLNLDIPIQL